MDDENNQKHSDEQLNKKSFVLKPEQTHATDNSPPTDEYDPATTEDAAEVTPEPAVLTTPSTPEGSQTNLDTPTVFTAPTSANTRKSTAGRFILITLVAVLLAAFGLAGWLLLPADQPADVQTQMQPIQELQSLRFGSVEGPADSFFPASVGSGITFSQSRQMYEGLIGSRDRQYVPLLAESWTNPDQRTWEFKLRENVKFHTGKVMTAQDVKASFEELKKNEFWSLFVDTIESTEVTGTHQLKIVTKEPDPLLLNRLALAFVFDTDAMDKMGNNGTGAYQIDQSKKNDANYLGLVAFDDYHQGRPKTRYTEYKIYKTEEDLIAAAEKGEVDYLEITASQQFDERMKQIGFDSQTFDSPGIFGVYMNMERSDDSPLNNKEIRRAIALALNRDDLIEKLPGEGVPSTQVIPKSLPGHDPNIAFPDHDLDEAKAILAKEYPGGITLEYAYFKGVQVDAPIIIEQLRKAGFTIIEKDQTDPSALIGILGEGQWDLYSGAYTSDIFDSRDVLGSIVGPDSSYPTTNDKAYGDILAASDVEFDPTKRIAKLQEANRYIADNLLWMPMRVTRYQSFYRSDLVMPIDYEGGSNLGIYHWRVGLQKP